MLWGYDVSAYQPNFDHYRARREGFEFCGLRAVGSINNPDTSFHRHLRDARGAGMIVWCYLFVSDRFSARDQANTVMGHVPKDCPVVLDSEPTPWSGPVSKLWEITNILRENGYTLPLIYMGIPMHNQLGRPDLRGLGAGLWKPHYPDNSGGTASGIYGRVPGHFWNGYGGLPVSVLQFSQSATIAGNTPTDADAFLGTREELAALIGGQDMQANERQALFDILEQFTGSRTPGQYPGWPNLQGDNSVSLVDYIRFIDLNTYNVAGREAGQAEALTALAEALTGDEFNNEEFLGRVREATRAALAESVVDVNVDVSHGVTEGPEEPEVEA